MVGKRSKEEIIFQILEICQEDASKNMLVDATGKNFKSIDFYLNLLMKNGLLEFCGEAQTLYRTTKKGMGTLEHFRAIEELIPGRMH